MTTFAVPAALAALTTFAVPARAATLPGGFSDLVVASVPKPTAIAFLPDGRALVAAKTGQLYVVSGSGLAPTPILDLASRLCSNGERGLLGVAVDPAFASTRRLFLVYTYARYGPACEKRTARTPVGRLSSFTVGSDGQVAVASERVLVDNIPSFAGMHNGGDVAVGADGLVYVTVGDNGCSVTSPNSCSALNDNARRKDLLVGKILRVSASGSIPSTNPWASAAGARRCGDPAGVPAGSGPCAETFAWGLRNPFRFAFRPGTSRFLINDVGQDRWEEIDEGTPGADYGWNVREGHCATGSTTDCRPAPGFTDPIYDYDHADGCASITGGAFVPASTTWPAVYAGQYLFADYVCGSIFRLVQTAGGYDRAPFVSGLGVSSATTMAFAPDGDLYYATFAAGGQIHRLHYSTGNQPPVGTLLASPRTGAAPLAVGFDATGSYDPEGSALTYEWSWGDGTPNATTTQPTSGHTYTADGAYTATLVVRDAQGLAGSPVVLRVQVGGRPSVVIDSPTGKFFTDGRYVLHGHATDAIDGALPASALSWVVILHHNTHTHPFLEATPGNDVPIIAPAPEDLAAVKTSYLEIQLTAMNSRGLTTTARFSFNPKIVKLTFASQPAGLILNVNEITVTGPAVVPSWPGFVLRVGAADQAGRPFRAWSDGGARTHAITTPSTATTYTARFG